MGIISFFTKPHPVLRRVISAVFDKGGDITLPAEPAPTPIAGQAPAVQPPVTVTIPSGVARDGAVQIGTITALYWFLTQILHVNLPFSQDQVVSAALVGVGIVGAVVARIRAKNITRG